MRTLQILCSRLPARLRWAPHNLVAHPMSELLFQLGLEDVSDWIHEATVPDHVRGEGRG